MKQTEKKVLKWAEEKGLLKKDNIINQLNKFNEEVEEFTEEVALENVEDAKMELGDVLVTLSILSNQLDSNLNECLEMAYDKIKARKGKTINGIFVKESDLKK